MKIKTIGLPVMHKEAGERRAFLPSFIEKLNKYDVDVYMEEGYGNKMGFTKEDYKKVNRRVRFVNNKEVFQQDLIIVLRAPNYDEINNMKENAGLLSMLHYDSKPELREALKKKKVNSFSLDSIVNDANQRMVVTYEQTAWAGVCTAVDEMEKRRNDFYSEDRPPYYITVLGMGNLGINAGYACFKYMEEKINNKGVSKKIPGMILTYLEKDTTHLKEELKKIFAVTDLLIDATKRVDFTKYIITNDLIEYFKKDTIILDLTADPYDASKDPVQVKAIEGIPYGTLDKYVFETDAPEYNDIPPGISTIHRRVVVSCNGWPGVFPERAMRIYEDQLIPLISILVNKGYNLSIDSDNPYERALYRSTIRFFEDGF